MDLNTIRDLDYGLVNKIRAEEENIADFPFQVAHINLESRDDPAAVVDKDKEMITSASDKHSYAEKDRIFPINQDENSVFAQYVYEDCLKYNYQSALDVGTGSGVLAVACAKAGIGQVVGTDINQRAEKFVEINNRINKVGVRFVLTDLFEGISEKFDKIVMDPPFMPSPKAMNIRLMHRAKILAMRFCSSRFLERFLSM